MNKLTHLVAPFLLAAAGFAQETAVSAPQAPARAAVKEPFAIEAGEVKLPALIDRCAAYLDCNILWDARDMEGPLVRPLRLQQAITTDADGCLELLASSLSRGGFALTWADEKKRTLEAIPMSGIRGREIHERAASRDEAEVLARPNLKMPVTVVLALQHTNANVACNALRPVFAAAGAPGGGGGLTLGTMGNNHSMVVTGMQDRVAQAILLIRELDRGPPGEAPPFDAQKRIEKLEKRVEELEMQLKILTDKLADALKNRK